MIQLNFIRIGLAGIGALTVVVSAPSFAQPALYNKCSNVRIQPVPNGGGVYLSEDCKTAYVLPPLRGSFQLAAMTVTENLQLCPAVEGSMKVIAGQYQHLEALSQKLAAGGSGQSSGGGGSVLFPHKPDAGPNQTDIMAAIKEAQAISTELGETLKTYAGVEGSTAQAILGAEHQQLVDAYQAANPGLHFEPMPIASTELRFDRRVTPTASTILPVVLGINIVGKPPLAPGGQPSDDGASLFGGIASGQLILSLAGACPFYDVANQKMKIEKISGRSLAPYFNAKVNFTYNLAIHRAYHAEFNARGFFKRLQESESSGGFFSTKTVNRLIVERDSSGWFVFNSRSQDPSFEFEESLRETVKAQMIDRTFKQIAMLTSGGPEAAPPLSQPKADGAEVGADNLRKCPYVYCQIGAAVLDVANSIWGNTRSISDFLNSYSGWEKEDVDESRALPFQGATVFVE